MTKHPVDAEGENSVARQLAATEQQWDAVADRNDYAADVLRKPLTRDGAPDENERTTRTTKLRNNREVLVGHELRYRIVV